jgi:phi13 family phage major tail protein
MANKVRFGLKNLYFAGITSATTPTFGTPVALPGAVSISLTPKGEQSDFYADDGLYYTAAKNNGYDVELEIAEIPQAFLTAHLGFALDDQNNLVERDDDAAVPFVLLFEFDGDANATKHALFNCKCTRPSQEASTKTETAEPQTTKLSIVASPLKNVVKISSTATTLNTTTWYTTVPFPDPIPSV